MTGGIAAAIAVGYTPSEKRVDDLASVPVPQGRPCRPPRRTMAWILLFFAGLLEIVWAAGLKSTEGFTRPWPTVGTLAAMAASLGLLGLSLRTIPLGTAYAVWTSIGVVGTGIVGIVVHGEPATAGRMACVVMILAGVVGLKLTMK